MNTELRIIFKGFSAMWASQRGSGGVFIFMEDEITFVVEGTIAQFARVRFFMLSSM